MMAGESSSCPSSSSKSSSSAVDDKQLLKFYQKKFEEYQKKEDKYKEKVDRHLKNLVADRHELEEEVLRRGEKISDLQKALVELQLNVFEERERFLQVSAENEELKRNEEQLHTNIHQLLAMTHQQDLRDKIIYILKDPKVEIGYQTEFSTKSRSPAVSFSGNQKLKQELDYLQNQLDEVLKISRKKSDVLLEDCKQALERSKEKIMQDQVQIRDLQKRLHNLNIQDKKKSSAAAAESFSSEHPLIKSASDSSAYSKICSQLKDIHLSLILLLKVISKIMGLLNSIQATKLYHRMVNIPKAPSDMQHIVEENTVVQLETSLRRCTRLTFDINNMLKSLTKYVSNNKKRIQNINVVRSELKHLEEMLKELTILTAENDLLNVGLKRSAFFYALRDSSVAIEEEDRVQHINDFRKIISNSEILSKTVSRAADFVESVIQKYNAKWDYWHNVSYYPQEFSSESLELQEQATRNRNISRQATRNRISTKSDSELVTLKQATSESLKDLENLLGIYKHSVQEAENLGLGLSAETKLLSEKLKTSQKRLEKCDDNLKDVTMKPEATQTELKGFDYEEILRKINKTLSKVKLVEQGEYLKDEQLCRKLAENVNELTKKFKELTQEFNVKCVQDQFSEYSQVTLSKLEELAKQSRNSVIAAEAQIAAHRSNAKHLSQKLKETEELLRESINECLSLKHKGKQSEEQHEMDKYTLISGLREKLDKITNLEEVQNIVDELVIYITDHKGTKADPFVCIYCQQGIGHRLCQEKLKELKAEVRKLQTQLKMLQSETKQEKATFKQYQEIAEKAAADFAAKSEAMKETLKTLEAKNVSLLEQLKVEKKRVKNMERFRHLEIEGFQTDIKNLKAKIRDLEKQLLKAVLVFESNNKDMELLKTVHETAQRSKEATAALRRLKAKLYELENDIKSL